MGIEFKKMFAISAFRRTPSFSHSCLASQLTIRGAKKKKGGGAAAMPESTDIVNIFKDGKDAPIYPTDAYPPWLMDLLKPQFTPDELTLQMYRGERIPDTKEQWTLAKSLRRLAIKDRNKLHKFDHLYESDDDFGESLGGSGVRDIDEEVEGELGSDGEVIVKEEGGEEKKEEGD